MLVGLLALTLLGAAAVLLAPGRAAKPTAAAFGLASLVLYAWWMAAGHAGVNWSWIPEWGIRFHLGGDGLTRYLVGLAVVLVPAAVLAAPAERGRGYFFWLLFTEFAAVGLFAALDLLLFYAFFEAVLLPIFFLLTGFGGPPSRAAGMRFLVMNLVGSFFMLVGIVGVVAHYAALTGRVSFEMAPLFAAGAGTGLGGWLILASFLLAFAIKAPLWPLHGWMPAAYGESDPPVTAVLSGLLSKAGIFGLLRVVLPLFGSQLYAIQGWLIAASLVGLLWGALMALRQRDAKMVAAYASLSHMSMMALGIFSLTAPGILGATFQMVAHGLMVGGLFLILGFVEQRAGTRDLAALQGMARATPRLAAYFLIFALALLGLPGLPGFVGEYLIIQGLVVHNLPAAVVAGFVLVVAAWYMLRLFQGVMHGPEATPAGARRRDLGPGAVALTAAMAVLVMGLGVWPAAITSSGAPSLFRAVHLSALKGGWRL